nr:MAG TPA: hypothetical protein [Caudoviricetes sp.]
MGNENRFTSTERDLELREEIRRKRAKDAADLAEAKRLNAETARINADSWKQIAEAKRLNAESERLNADTDRILRRGVITASVAAAFSIIALIVVIVRRLVC